MKGSYFQQIGDLQKAVDRHFCNSTKRLEELRFFQSAVGCEEHSVLKVSEPR